MAHPDSNKFDSFDADLCQQLQDNEDQGQQNMQPGEQDLRIGTTNMRKGDNDLDFTSQVSMSQDKLKMFKE